MKVISCKEYYFDIHLARLRDTMKTYHDTR